MFDLSFVVALLFTIKELIKEKFGHTTYSGTRFDWDAYYNDINNGIPSVEQVKRRQQGAYQTIEPLPNKSIPDNGIVDVDRYEYDKREYGDYIAESWRKSGHYRYIKKSKKS